MLSRGDRLLSVHFGYHKNIHKLWYHTRQLFSELLNNRHVHQ